MRLWYFGSLSPISLLRDLGAVPQFTFPASTRLHTFLKNCSMINRCNNLTRFSINVDNFHSCDNSRLIPEAKGPCLPSVAPRHRGAQQRMRQHERSTPSTHLCLEPFALCLVSKSYCLTPNKVI